MGAAEVQVLKEDSLGADPFHFAVEECYVLEVEIDSAEMEVESQLRKTVGDHCEIEEVHLEIGVEGRYGIAEAAHSEIAEVHSEIVVVRFGTEAVHFEMVADLPGIEEGSLALQQAETAVVEQIPDYWEIEALED